MVYANTGRWPEKGRNIQTHLETTFTKFKYGKFVVYGFLKVSKANNFGWSNKLRLFLSPHTVSSPLHPLTPDLRWFERYMIRSNP